VRADLRRESAELCDADAALRGRDVVVDANGEAGRCAIGKDADQLTVRRQRRALMVTEQRASVGDAGARRAIREVVARVLDICGLEHRTNH
jgi:hypothetical protein